MQHFMMSTKQQGPILGGISRIRFIHGIVQLVQGIGSQFLKCLFVNLLKHPLDFFRRGIVVGRWIGLGTLAEGLAKARGHQVAVRELSAPLTEQHQTVLCHCQVPYLPGHVSTGSRWLRKPTARVQVGQQAFRILSRRYDLSACYVQAS